MSSPTASAQETAKRSRPDRAQPLNENDSGPSMFRCRKISVRDAYFPPADTIFCALPAGGAAPGASAALFAAHQGRDDRARDAREGGQRHLLPHEPVATVGVPARFGEPGLPAAGSAERAVRLRERRGARELLPHGGGGRDPVPLPA